MGAGTFGPADIGCKVNYRGVYFQVSPKCTECPLPECYLESAAAVESRYEWAKLKFRSLRPTRIYRDVSDRVQITVEMTKDGYLSAEIAEALKVSPATVRYYRRTHLNPNLRRKPIERSPRQVVAAHRRANAVEWKEWGLSTRMIAKEMGISQTRVRMLLREAESGLTAREIEEAQ